MRRLRPLEEPELVDAALDAASAAFPRFRRLAHSVGFRSGVLQAVQALRGGGVSLEEWDRLTAKLGGGRREFIGRILREYEEALTERGAADEAEEARLALAALRSWREAQGGNREGQAGWPVELAAEEVFILSGVVGSGLAGMLLDELRSSGAGLVPAPAVVGYEPPSAVFWRNADRPGALSFVAAPDRLPESGGSAPRLDGPRISLFGAASATDELRSVLRRILEAGLAWDEVEIVAADSKLYGSALHALASGLKIPVTYADGIDASRTRVGRAVKAYLDWIEGGFHARIIHRLIEAGDIRPPGWADKWEATPNPSDLARRFRSLRVGWGRDRHLSQLDIALEDVETEPVGGIPSGGAADPAKERRRRAAQQELHALGSVLRPLVFHAPTPEKTVSAAALAESVRKFLELVPGDRDLDPDVMDKLDTRLLEIGSRLTRKTSLATALAILRRQCDIRVRGPGRSKLLGGGEAGDGGRFGSDDRADGWPAPRTVYGTEAPSRSTGGYLHMSSLAAGGLTGRRAVFLVGFDADSEPGAIGSDSLLSEGDHNELGQWQGGLPRLLSAVQRKAIARFSQAALLAKLSSAESVTLSYRAWDARESRTLSPSPVLLQALRVARRDPALGYRELRHAIGRFACPLPEPADPGSSGRSEAEAAVLDSDDLWLRALTRDGGLLGGDERVRRAFPRLLPGHALFKAREGRPGPAQGVIGELPGLARYLPPERTVSATGLETLGTCPLRYLHRYVLGARPPDDPEFDRVRWLDAPTRGSVLHRVYSETLDQAARTGTDPSDPRFARISGNVLAAALKEAERRVPAPGQGAVARERRALAADVRSFVLLMRGSPRWLHTEFEFGFRSGHGAREVVLRFGETRVPLTGAIDRVDEVEGGLRVIDYKTGQPPAANWAGGDERVFRRGRQLQHALYSYAIEALLGRPVVDAGYLYPTARGQNHPVLFARSELSEIERRLPAMIAAAREGRFVPTDDKGDCRFCDYRSVCRVTVPRDFEVVSPLAAWSHLRKAEGDPSFAGLKSVRDGAGEGGFGP